MNRSLRSMPTGPGSRGGQWHDPEYRRAYFRRWRAEHPDYREREAARLARRDRGRLPLVTFTDALRSLLQAELAAGSARRSGRRLMIAHRTLLRIANGSRAANAETIDALVHHLGLDNIRAERARLRRVGMHERETALVATRPRSLAPSVAA